MVRFSLLARLQSRPRYDLQFHGGVRYLAQGKLSLVREAREKCFDVQTGEGALRMDDGAPFPLPVRPASRWMSAWSNRWAPHAGVLR